MKDLTTFHVTWVQATLNRFYDFYAQQTRVKVKIYYNAGQQFFLLDLI